MSNRATIRPNGFRKPAHWSDSPPPAPAPVGHAERDGPTRYGDWCRNGIAVDF
jgi:hypothetical protein